MRRLLLLLACLLLAGCAAQAGPPESTAPAPAIEEALVGIWVSADAGQLDLVETITLTAQGELSVDCVHRGRPAGSLRGSARSDGRQLVCQILQGAEPYTVRYDYVIDGRMLTLISADGEAHYLRNS